MNGLRVVLVMLVGLSWLGCGDKVDTKKCDDIEAKFQSCASSLGENNLIEQFKTIDCKSLLEGDNKECHNQIDKVHSCVKQGGDDCQEIYNCLTANLVSVVSGGGCPEITQWVLGLIRNAAKSHFEIYLKSID